VTSVARRWLGGLAVAAGAIALFIAITKATEPEAPPRSPAAAQQPQQPGGRPAQPPGPKRPGSPGLPHPVMPVLSPEAKAQIAEQVRGQERPGTAAFRAISDRYVDENLELATRQAASEGLTMPEFRELTYFGLMVMATQRIEDVEAITGHALTADERTRLGQLMQGANTEFKDTMRALVARGGGEAERWALIRSTQAHYQTELFKLTGLDAGALDDLLAGNAALPGAPIRGEAPAGAPAPGARDPLDTRPRPTRP
jgi:hypothetical protein